MKKKLIFVTEALWIGGIETALNNLLHRLDYNEYDVTILVEKAILDVADRLPQQCRLLIADREYKSSFKSPYKYVKLYHLTEKTDNPSRLHRALMWAVPLLRNLENWLYICYIRKLLRDDHFDTAIIYSDVEAELTVRGIKAEKYLLFYHDATIRKAYHDEIAYSACEKIIAVSENKAEELKKFRPAYADKIIYIHNLIGIREAIEKSRSEIDLPFKSTDFNVVTCARLAYQKAIDWAILACKKLVDNGMQELQWWIVGGGPDESTLQNLIKESGVSSHFHLLGMKDNPYPYIAKADLYVQTSRYENYSVVILEAMALCKPILATKPSAEMQITSGTNGFLCDATPDSIADSIDYLFHSPDECERYAYYLSTHSLEQENIKIIKQLLELF